jgi:hypothetical protein
MFSSNKYFDKLVDFLQSDKFSKNINKFNLILTSISFVVIYQTFQNLNLSNQVLTFSINTLVVGFLLYLANLTLWSRFMTNNYKKFSPTYLINWSRSRLGRYIPSGVLVLTIRIDDKLVKVKNSKKIIYGLIEEQFLLPLVGSATVIIYLNFKIVDTDYFNFFIASCVSVLVIKLIYYFLKIQFVSLIKFTLNFLLAINLNFIFLATISAEMTVENPYQIAAFYYLSTCLALFFVGIPAGIGVRELIFLYIANLFVNEVVIFELIVKTRLLYLIFDVFFGILGNIFYFLYKK